MTDTRMNRVEQPAHVTRVTLVDEKGRQYERWNVECELHYQDDGRTLKIFVARRAPE